MRDFLTSLTITMNIQLTIGSHDYILEYFVSRELRGLSVRFQTK